MANLQDLIKEYETGAEWKNTQRQSTESLFLIEVEKEIAALKSYGKAIAR